MNLEIKQPEPGTPLPVVVHEWNDDDLEYAIGYMFDGEGYVTADGEVQSDKIISYTFTLLGLPLSIKAKAVVE